MILPHLRDSDRVVLVDKMLRFLAALSIYGLAFGGIIPDSEPHSKENYIVGGKDTDIKEVPYQIALNYGKRFFCGGSIITPNHILTAGHCVEDFMNNFNIRAGSTNWNESGVVIPVKKVVYHPKYSFKTLDYDVGIIELETPLKFSETIKPIKVADKEPADGQLVKASGWGYLKEDGDSPINLQSVVVPMVNRKVCEKNYGYFLDITNRMICAGQEGKDACQGDSGGPLVYKGTVVGIVSTGEGCARKDRPGIYTNVANPEIRKFIKEHANV